MTQHCQNKKSKMLLFKCKMVLTTYFFTYKFPKLKKHLEYRDLDAFIITKCLYNNYLYLNLCHFEVFTFLLQWSYKKIIWLGRWSHCHCCSAVLSKLSHSSIPNSSIQLLLKISDPQPRNHPCSVQLPYDKSMYIMSSHLDQKWDLQPRGSFALHRITEC